MAGFIRIQVFFNWGPGQQEGGYCVIQIRQQKHNMGNGEVSLKKLDNLRHHSKESVEGVFEKQTGII